MSRKCPFLSPASELELRSLHPLVSPLPSLSLFHSLQLESVETGHRCLLLNSLTAEVVFVVSTHTSPRDLRTSVITLWMSSLVLQYSPKIHNAPL